MAIERGATWRELNRALMEATTEEEVQAMIDAEMKGDNRARWLLRMYGRFNVLRQERELRELTGATVNG